MGGCSSSADDRHSQRDSEPIDCVPRGTDSLKHKPLPVLAFYVLISDIKIKKCAQDVISLAFKVEGIDEFLAPPREIDRHSKAYWKISHAFEFYMTQYELRNKFLLVEVFNGQRHLLTSLKMNMFALWTGPYHLDFKLDIENSKNCRISFNFKISQGIHLTIQNVYTEMIPHAPRFYESRFAYTLQTIIGQQLEEAASPYIVCIKPNPKQFVKEEKGPVETVYVSRNKIFWSQQKCKKYPLPKFDKKIGYYEIYSSTIHIVFFRVLPGFTDQRELRYEMDSECFISLAKLMTTSYFQYRDHVTNITYAQRKVELVEKLWSHGKQMGKVILKFIFIMQSHLKQMQAGVRMEDGILTSSPVFTQGNAENYCLEIEELKQLHRDIQREFINLDRNSHNQHNLIMQKENILRINRLLAQQLAVIEKSSKESLLFYDYKDERELYKAQRFFIDLAFIVLTYIHQDNPQICEVCWSILTAILKRGEFKLCHLGFSNMQIESIQEKDISDDLQLKIDVALKYQELLNHLLKQTIALLKYKGEEAERTFAQSFCSYAYFRIPPFREHILTFIKKEEDPEIPEWRGTEVNLYEQESVCIIANLNDDFYSILFDWESRFYKPIWDNERFKQHKIQLQTILLEEKWKNRLSKRSGAFFSFLENLVQEIEYVSVVSKHIKWHQMPGYNRLLHAFLVQMEQLKIKNYTQRLKNTCAKLLSNEKLLNVFVAILLKKTNIYDPDAVEITLDMIDSFFQAIKRKKRAIPGTFDYIFFLQGLKVILNSELQYCISQALMLIYNNLFTFSQEFGLQLALYLLSKPFFKFFFHWSYNLRHIFHILVFTKINRYAEEKQLAMNSKSNVQNAYIMSMRIVIKQRYDCLMNIIKKEIDPTVHILNQDMYLEKVLYKKMKSKMERKRLEQGRGVQALASIQDISLPDLRYTKSISKFGGKMSPTKLIYFMEEDMTLIPPHDELRYVKIAINEFETMKQSVQECLQKNPRFTPEIKLRKITDEKDLGPIISDEW